MDVKLIECQKCGIKGFHACIGVKQKDVDLFALSMKANTFPLTAGDCVISASNKNTINFYKRKVEFVKSER